MTWDKPEKESRHGIITRYQVWYREASVDFPLSVFTTQQSLDIDGLEPDTEYLVAVQAFTRIGAGVLSPYISFKTRKGMQ